MPLYPLCAKGHELAPHNVRREYSRSNGFRLRLRCKACVKEQKERWYADEINRSRRLAYDHWYRNGHPEGRSWDEIKTEFTCNGDDNGRSAERAQ